MLGGSWVVRVPHKGLEPKLVGMNERVSLEWLLCLCPGSTFIHNHRLGISDPGSLFSLSFSPSVLTRVTAVALSVFRHLKTKWLKHLIKLAVHSILERSQLNSPFQRLNPHQSLVISCSSVGTWASKQTSAELLKLSQGLIGMQFKPSSSKKPGLNSGEEDISCPASLRAHRLGAMLSVSQEPAVLVSISDQEMAQSENLCLHLRRNKAFLFPTEVKDPKQSWKETKCCKRPQFISRSFLQSLGVFLWEGLGEKQPKEISHVHSGNFRAVSHVFLEHGTKQSTFML